MYLPQEVFRMAISATTDWSKIRYAMLLVFATSVLLASTVATGLATSGILTYTEPTKQNRCVRPQQLPSPETYLNLSPKKPVLFLFPHQFITRISHKRQLFREHLLPQQGGKIPESAFRPDRLALNRLNQQGIYSSEGLYLERRHPEVHFHPKLWTAETLKLTLRPDNRYVAPVGGYHFQSPRTVDTTYLIREPVRTTVVPLLPFYRASPLAPQTSLKLLRYHLHHSNDFHDSPWNEVFTPNGFSYQVLEEFAPYLRKLHEFDYD